MNETDYIKFDILLKQNNFKLWLALKHHRTHKNKKLDFTKNPFQKAIYLDESPHQVDKKSTQAGVTEKNNIEALAFAIKGLSVFYVLPTDKLVSRFVRNRMDKSISNTLYYKELERKTRLLDERKKIDSMFLKDLGKGTIAFVGSNSSAGFTEFPADVYIIDELDECNQENIQMGYERLSNSEYRYTRKVGNPTIPDFGIDYEYNLSDKKHWFIKCDICGHWFTPDFFENIVRQVDENDFIIRDPNYEIGSEKDINLICSNEKCGRPVHRFKDGEWVKEKEIDISGRYINKLFSANTTIKEIVERFEKGLINPTIMQRFYNGDLGLAYIGKGAKITEDIINDCIRHYKEKSFSKNPCFVGVDVGSILNVIIAEEYQNSLMITAILELTSEEQILDLFKCYNIKVMVIDSRPEYRMVRRLKARLNQIWSCDYLTDNEKDSIDDKSRIYKTDRTTSMDAVKEGLQLENIILPENAKNNKAFISQVTAPVRVFKENKNDPTKEGRFIWMEGHKQDHFFHSLVYVIIARKLLLMSKR
jgi:hypothetical protein